MTAVLDRAPVRIRARDTLLDVSEHKVQCLTAASPVRDGGQWAPLELTVYE